MFARVHNGDFRRGRAAIYAAENRYFTAERAVFEVQSPVRSASAVSTQGGPGRGAAAHGLVGRGRGDAGRGLGESMV